MEDFEVVSTPLALRNTVSNVILAAPRAGAFPRDPVGKLKAVFLGVNKKAIFQHVAEMTTIEMDRKVREGDVTGQNAERYYKTPVTSDEILIILGLQFVFYCRKGNRTIDEQFNDIPPDRAKFPITKKRYSAIMGCLCADFVILPELLRTSWQDAITPGTDFAVDETIYAYAGKDPGSPKRFIPRKPHKNGLLSFGAGFFTDHGPYLFDVVPDYIFNQPLNGRAALRAIVERWPWTTDFHVVVDAGFSGDQEHQLLGDLSCKFTASINQAHKKWLVDLLKKYCDYEKHIAVIDAHGLVWSFGKDRLDNAEHFVVSNAFKTTAKKAREIAINEDQAKSLAKVGLRGLNLIADKLGLPSSLNDIALANSIAEHINSMVPLTPVAPPPASSSSASSSSAAVQPPQDDFGSKTVPQLAEIAKRMGIKVGGLRKEAVLIAIRNASAISGSKVESTKRDIQAGVLGGDRALHNKYTSTFNSIDQHDRKWYDVQNHHDINRWEAKFTMCLLISGVINASVVYSHFEAGRNTDFCLPLGECLVWE